MEIRVISVEEWENIPVVASSKKDSPLEDVLDQLESGQILEITFPDPKMLKGSRIGLGRRAKNRGYVLSFRVIGNSTLAVRRSDIEPPEAPPSPPPPPQLAQPKRRKRA